MVSRQIKFQFGNGEVPVKVFTEDQKREICRLRATKTPKQLAQQFHTQVFRIHKVLNEGRSRGWI